MTNTSTKQRLTAAALAATLAISASAMVAGAAQAQSTASSTANAVALVIDSISITGQRDLLFGNIIPDTTLAGTVRVPPKESAVAAVAVVTHIGGEQSAKFLTSGSPSTGVTYDLVVPPTIIGGGSFMQIRNWLIGFGGVLDNGVAPPRAGTTSSGGTQTVYVGATIDVADNQPPGTYTNTFDITVTYN